MQDQHVVNVVSLVLTLKTYVLYTMDINIIFYILTWIQVYIKLYPECQTYTRRQINQDRMIFGDFSVNSKPIFFKFCKGHFLFKSQQPWKFRKII